RAGLFGGVEPDRRPCRLRGRRGAAAAPGLVAIRAEVLAEAAARVLHLRQPVDGSRHAWMVAQPAGGEGGEDGARAVDVVRPPAPEPGALAFLLAQQPLETALRDGLVLPPLA